MATMKLTHIGLFFQEFSHPIPHLKELRVWKRALLTRARQMIRIISVISDEEMARKRLDLAQRWGVPPYNPCPFLSIP